MTKSWASSALQARRRRQVIARDGLNCHWCGIVCTDEKGSPRQSPTKATLDHVTPRSKGGTHEVGNLVIACATCNVERSKGQDPKQGRRAQVRAPQYGMGLREPIQG